MPCTQVPGALGEDVDSIGDTVAVSLTVVSLPLASISVAALVYEGRSVGRG